MAVAKKTTKKKKIVRQSDKGQVHIQASFNNTIVTFTDLAAQQCVEDAGRVAKEQGIRTVEVYVKGPGNGREAAIRALGNLDLNVSLIQDVSPIAHNGCRPPKRRRL